MISTWILFWPTTFFCYFLGGWTYTGRALNLAYSQLFTSSKGARGNVARVSKNYCLLCLDIDDNDNCNNDHKPQGLVSSFKMTPDLALLCTTCGNLCNPSKRFSVICGSYRIFPQTRVLWFRKLLAFDYKKLGRYIAEDHKL